MMERSRDPSAAFLENIQQALRPLGYAKMGSTFRKAENEFYKLIDIQKGSHGGGYFFINVCLHPIGLPNLITGKLEVPSQPLEFECIIRQRIEQVVGTVVADKFKNGLVLYNDSLVVSDIVRSLSTDAERWLNCWASFDRLAQTSPKDLENMITTVVPILKTKAILMLRYFCTLKSGNQQAATKWLSEYLATKVAGLEFPEVDRYLVSLR
jgi:hypothetical protein